MEENKDGIEVIILDNSISLSTIKNVKIIRIKDNNYNLLIMKDYWPILGEIHGTIIIESDIEYKYENIYGFYTLTNNIFHLIIKEKRSS